MSGANIIGNSTVFIGTPIKEYLDERCFGFYLKPGK